MTAEEQQALYFFKEHTKLELRGFLVEQADRLSEKEIEIIKKALEYYRMYEKLKLIEI